MVCASSMRCPNRPPTGQRSLSVAASSGFPAATAETAAPADEPPDCDGSEAFLQLTTASARTALAAHGNGWSFIDLRCADACGYPPSRAAWQAATSHWSMAPSANRIHTWKRMPTFHPAPGPASTITPDPKTGTGWKVGILFHV